MRPEPYSSILLAGMACLSAGCAFDASSHVRNLLPLPSVPITEVTSSRIDLVFEDEGTIAVYHGFGCAESNRRGRESILRIRQETTVPEYVNAATVFLNGWKMKYLRGDHEVSGFLTSVGAINLGGGTLSWQAAGVLSDHNFDDGYRWCYYFTAIGWNSSNLAVSVDHDDDRSHQAISRADDHTTALKVIPGFLQNSAYPFGVRAALLPRSFGAEWETTGSDVPDHHLLQIAYNMDYAERFVDGRKEYSQDQEPSLPSPASHVDIDVITRDSKTIFKDNRTRRSYDSGEAVSVLVGADVGYVQPPFSVLPREDSSFTNCIGSVSSTREVVIENVPFKYAVPVLTGWDLFYDCDDEHVTEMGVWLESFQYNRPIVTLGGGTLRYTFSSVLRDHDSAPSSGARERVHILGFKSILTHGPVRRIAVQR